MTAEPNSMNKNDKIEVLIVYNKIKKPNVELFRIHLYEQNIEFDSRFQEGIDSHPELRQIIKEINQMWSERLIDQKQLYVMMLRLMITYANYLKDYYFKDYELNKEGEYIETLTGEERVRYYFNYFQSSSNLKRIPRKEFEMMVGVAEQGQKYIEFYQKKGVLFYKGSSCFASNRNMTWYFMKTGDKVPYGFFLYES